MSTDPDVKEQLRRHGVRLGKGGVAPAVFWPGALGVAAVAIFVIIFPDAADEALTTIQSAIVSTFSWYYMLVVAVFIGFAIWMGASRFGEITLGKDGEEAEFGLLSWFAMLFAAGMGIGLVFFGVGEPLIFATDDPKPGTEGSESEMALLGMAQAFVHWGLHPWAVYAVIGLALAYAIHRRGRPVSIRWALEPLFGDRVRGWVGDVIDVLAIFGTIFGVATSLGLGVQQIATGLAAMGVVTEASDFLLVALIVVITLVATMSVVSGLSRGIRWLSNINLSMAGVLLISVLLLGPTLFLLRDFVQSLGVYLANVFNMTLDPAAFTGDEGQAWLGDWTIFYWAWWISWAPFVGVFIARISRGRTIREFIGGVLLVPTVMGFLWFSVMGGTAIHRQFFGAGDLVPEDGVVAEEALFEVLGGLPLGEVLSWVAIVMVAIFFITSSDSASLVVDMLASGGHPNPPTWSRVMWAVLEGLIAAGLLLAGGLEALQAGAITTALPFSVILLLICVATYRALRDEHRQLQAMERRARRRELTGELEVNFEEHFGEQVDERINYAMTQTTGVRSRRGRRPARATGTRNRPRDPDPRDPDPRDEEG